MSQPRDRPYPRAAHVVAAFGVMLLIGAAVGVANLAEGTDTVAPRIADPTATGLVAADTTAASTTVRNGIAIIPGSDDESVATLEALPHPGVTVLTETSLTDAIADQVGSAIEELEPNERSGLVQVRAAFENDGVIHAVMEYASGQSALLVVENGESTRVRRGEGSWVDVHGLRKDTTASWFGYTQVTWLGLPEDAALARLTTPERPSSIEIQAIIGNAAFFEIAKPDWTQIGTLTLFDSSGNEIMTDETRLHGKTCSSWLAGPVNAELPPSALTTGRMALAEALYACRPVSVAKLALGDGPYFNTAPADLVDTLREADQRTGLFSAMLYALKFSSREIEADSQTVYVFGWNINPDLGVELGFTEEGIWQFARYVDK